MTPRITIYDWPAQMTFTRASSGYDHNKRAGQAYFTGRAQGVILAIPKRWSIDAGGIQRHHGLVELMRQSLVPNNLVRLSDPLWCKGRSPAVARLALGIVWEDGADWDSGAQWRQPIRLTASVSDGAPAVTMDGLPPGEQIFRPGDIFGIGGIHYMASGARVSDSRGVVTVPVQGGVTAFARAGDVVEYPVRHLFSVEMGIAQERNTGLSFEWSGVMTEAFQFEYDGVTFDEAKFLA